MSTYTVLNGSMIDPSIVNRMARDVLGLVRGDTPPTLAELIGPESQSLDEQGEAMLELLAWRLVLGEKMGVDDEDMSVGHLWEQVCDALDVVSEVHAHAEFWAEHRGAVANQLEELHAGVLAVISPVLEAAKSKSPESTKTHNA